MASYEDIYVDQGASFSAEVAVKRDGLPFDLSNYTYAGQIRRKTNAAEIVTSFNITLSQIPGETNILLLTLSPVQTMALTLPKYVFDIEATSNSNPNDLYRIMQGMLFVSPNVTR